MSIPQAGLSNPSQVLLRNPSLLTGKKPLLINLPEDGFIDAYLELTPHGQITCHNNNYIDYQAISTKHGEKVSCGFSSVYQSELRHDLVIIAFPKSKAELAYTLAMLAKNISEETTFLFVGEKKGGVQSTSKLTANFLNTCHKIDAARHCMLFAGTAKSDVINKAFNLEDWFQYYEITLDDFTLTVASLPGVFSQQKLDVGTALLLKHLPKNISGEVLDFGCGAGVISSFIGKKFPQAQLSLLDVSALALTSAEKTLSLNKLTGSVFASNSLSEVKASYQFIVSNPPFHQGVKTHYQATETFLSEIKNYMDNQGVITIVANSFLKYPPIMNKHIGNTKTLTTQQGFSIYQASIK